MSKILPIVSYILNGILIILLFFKSALNDILKEWYKERQNIKREKITKLKKLRSIVDKLKRLSFIMLVNSRSIVLNKSAPDYEELINMSKKYTKEWGEFYQDIIADKADYPKNILGGIENFFKIFQSYNGEILSGMTDKNQIDKNHDELKDLLDIIIKNIDKII